MYYIAVFDGDKDSSQNTFLLLNAILHELTFEYTIDTYSCRQDLLELIRKNPAYYDVVFVDIPPEDTSTVELCRDLNALHMTARIVFLSSVTDYVFDGTKNSPYTPEDKPNPVNNYGLTKLKGEEVVKKYCEKYYIARTSWLYGHHGKNFVETMISLAKDRPELKVVDDQIGCPTWTVELANGIIKLFDKPYGTYHVCGSGSTSWYGFAKEILKNCEVKILPCTTEEFPRPARRPKYSIMDNGKICRNWQDALKDYMELRFEEVNA